MYKMNPHNLDALHRSNQDYENSTANEGSMIFNEKYFGQFDPKRGSNAQMSGMVGSQSEMSSSKLANTVADPPIREGHDHFKKLYTFIQRKVEYENYRFKHPTLLAIVVESINSRITDKQRMFSKLFYRFHVSQDLTIGDI